MQIGKIINGYRNEFGVTLGSIKSINEDEVSLDVSLYAPDDADFAWAVQELEALESN